MTQQGEVTAGKSICVPGCFSTKNVKRIKSRFQNKNLFDYLGLSNFQILQTEFLKIYVKPITDSI